MPIHTPLIKNSPIPLNFAIVQTFERRTEFVRINSESVQDFSIEDVIIILMIIIVTLALLLLIFFCIRKHPGAALLAMIAGLATYEIFGINFAAQIHGLVPSWDLAVIERIIYLAFILAFPLLLYFRSDRGGFRGLFRLFESAVFAIILTALIAEPLSEIFAFDSLSRDIANWVITVKGYVIVSGIIGAYLDILLYHPDRHPH